MYGYVSIVSFAPRGMLPLRAYGVALASMLAGASVVHNLYKPDLTIPGYEPSTSEEHIKKQQN